MPPKPPLKMELDHDPNAQVDALLRKLTAIENELRAIGAVVAAVVTTDGSRLCVRIEPQP